jgi:hypothetical protein
MARINYALNSYTGGATPNAIISGTITAVATSITVTGTDATWGTLGSTGGFFAALQYGIINEEKIFVPSGSYNWSAGVLTLTNVVRGVDNTTASGFTGVTFIAPVLTATDLSEANFVSSILLGNNTNVAISGITISGVSTASTTKGLLSVGSPVSVADTNQLATFVSSVNTYNGIDIQNLSNGSLANCNYVTYNDLGTPTTYYGAFGINSSTYASGTGPMNQPNAVYVQAVSGELALGTLQGGGIHFVVSGWSAAPYDSIVISGNGTIGIKGAVTLSGSLTMSGSQNPTYYMPPSYVAPYKAWTVDPALIGTGSVVVLTGTLFYNAIWVPQPMTISGISYWTTSTLATTATLYLGLFNSTTQLAVCSGVKGTGSSLFQTALISGGTYQITTPGLYYIGAVISGTGVVTPTLIAPPTGPSAAVMNMNINTQTNSVTGLRCGSVVIGNRALYANNATISGSIVTSAINPFFALS